MRVEQREWNTETEELPVDGIVLLYAMKYILK